jgi:hypothetical protein
VVPLRGVRTDRPTSDPICRAFRLMVIPVMCSN